MHTIFADYVMVMFGVLTVMGIMTLFLTLLWCGDIFPNFQTDDKAATTIFSAFFGLAFFFVLRALYEGISIVP